MSLVQRFAMALLPRKAAEAMRADSQQWMMRCTGCGLEKSIWALGGIRWKAAGNPVAWRKCAGCGQRTKHEIYRKSGAAAG